MKEAMALHSADNLGLIVMESARELGRGIDDWLHQTGRFDAPSYIVQTTFSRFGTGEGKVRLNESVRGRDIFILTDVCNYSVTFKMRGINMPMTPDEHYMDIKRAISAISGKANRVSVIMPYLYGGRQHKRTGRESLDAALMLRELTALGVGNIFTFDAHDPRVENAIPFHGFDNLMPTYQMIKGLFHIEGLGDVHDCVVVSPDEGAVTRNLVYANALGLDFGTFYKQRDLRHVVNGKNPITKHEYMGPSVAGRPVIVTDDVLASGESLLSVARELRERGASQVVLIVTFPQFTEGLDAYKKAYDDGMITKVLSTNLTYRPPELLNAPWYMDIDLAKYLALIISSVHQDTSINRLLNPTLKIAELLSNNGYFEKHPKNEA